MATRDEIREKHPLERVIEERVSPIPASRKVLCPFHEESTPSFHVYPDNTWHCFGCRKGGDVVQFLAYFFHGKPAKDEVLFQVLEMLGEIGVTPYSDEEKEKRYQEREKRYQTELQKKQSARERFFLYALRSMRQVTDEHRDIFRSWAINDEWQQRARLGFDGQRLTIPAFFRDVTFGVKRRRLPSLDALAAPDDPKYNSLKYPSLGIYNADVLLSRPSSVIVCEDEKSALAICSAGGIAIATNGCAGFWRGKKVDNIRWWARWLDNIPQLYFWRDADEIGIAQWKASKEYQEKERVIAPHRGDRFFLKCVEGGKSSESFPTGILRDGTTIEEGSVKWRVSCNPGLQCALDFRAWFPRVEIVDSAPYKDASDALADGIEWQEVIL